MQWTDKSVTHLKKKKKINLRKEKERSHKKTLNILIAENKNTI
jgi:hypothetical protein